MMMKRIFQIWLWIAGIALLAHNVVPHHHHHEEEEHCAQEHESENICFIEIDEALLRIGVGSESQCADSDLAYLDDDSFDTFLAEVLPLWVDNDEGLPFVFPPRISSVSLLCHRGASALRAPPVDHI